ncbi:replication initiation and membrane attachment family protein [Candidatus Phytoplasma sacchari]|uniref:Replicative helicase loading/DNA remodeling protein DnaB N-terminal winged helix domain-containing protein n=1 Tax=Candidatus Phytoplasma sacchari TaxID=2609813 RepID=A0ABY7M3C5_9MOLU|nr:hypothetical protein [Candidatus Phytoplasma sacchari]KAB8122870.1 hypothetical protein F2B49_00070 [Candidatus Phytoplasma sacchari]WBL31358.1 hypothetical protein O7R10_01980 [Candidatus Phytoplasma sacchari]
MYLLEKIKIKNNKNLSLEDYRILTLLYAPIIGNYSFFIYQTLYCMSPVCNNYNAEYDYKFLLEFLNMDFNFFQQNKYKLEAVGLLQTLQDLNDVNKKIYFVQPPVNTYYFFRDPILSQFLFSTIGEENYLHLEKVIFGEDKLNLANYQNISKNFHDVFCFKQINIKKEISNYKNKDNNNLNNNFYNNFDFEIFIENLSDRFKKPFLFEYHNINYLMKLSFVYGLSPKEMSLIYQDVFRKNYEEELDLNKLRTFLKRKYLKEDYKIQSIGINNIKNETDEMIIYLKNTDPYRVIHNFAKNFNSSINLQNIVFKLVEQNSDIEKGIFNSLIMYVCKIKEHEDVAFLSYNYFQTILDSWLDQGIISTELAYNFLIKKTPKKIKINKKNSKIRPKWLDDIKKNLTFNNE